jgi:NADPH-dependent glutamate synthase beta subunit-like oxidoreductase
MRSTQPFLSKQEEVLMANRKRPTVCMSMAGTQGTKTGRWGVMIPVFQEKMAPCRVGCPGAIQIPDFIQHVQADDIERAWRVILENNPLPRITGRVCYHPCENRCNRKDYDEYIAIQALERFVGDWAFEKGLSPLDGIAANGKRVAVVGAGPAGIGCAFYLARSGYRVSVFEARPEPGGLLRYGIPEYRLPKRILSQELEMIFGSGIEIKKGVAVGKDISWDDLRADYQGIFLGVGAQVPIKLGLDGDTPPDVMDGVPFLQICENKTPFESGQRVLIIGGGNTALDVARTVLRRKGVPLVLYRRTREEMPAFADEIREAEAEGIEIRYLVSPRIIIREAGRVKGLECIKNRMAPAGADDRRAFVPLEDSAFFEAGDLVVAALGQYADTTDLPPEVTVTDQTVVVADDHGCGPQGIYAGGDVTDMPRSVIHALASGKRAALALDAYLRHADKCQPESHEAIPEVTIQQINLAYFEITSRQRPQTQPTGIRVSSFKEVTATLPAGAAAREAARCFGCGNCNTCGNCYFFCPDFAVHRDSDTSKVFIDNDYCKGCCICVEECPRGVLSAEVKK